MLAFERGGWRTAPNDYAIPFDQDELRYFWRHHLFQNVAHTTLTFRNKPDQQALPMRRLLEYSRRDRESHAEVSHELRRFGSTAG